MLYRIGTIFYVFTQARGSDPRKAVASTHLHRHVYTYGRTVIVAKENFLRNLLTVDPLEHLLIAVNSGVGVVSNLSSVVNVSVINALAVSRCQLTRRRQNVSDGLLRQR